MTPILHDNSLQVGLRSAVDDSRAPGAVALVGQNAEIHFHEAIGLAQRVPTPSDAHLDTIYDLASLSKVVSTTTAILQLWEQGALDIDAPVTEHLPIPAYSAITPRHLLTHTAGLLSGMPLYRSTQSVEEQVQRYAESGLRYPVGDRHLYSDVGFLLLGRIVELVSRTPLDRYAKANIFDPNGMERTTYLPPTAWRDDIAPTEQCPWRGRIIHGEVHDENASAVGGVAGHAGLFSTAGDLAKFAQAMIEGRLFSETTRNTMTNPGQVPFYPWQGLGWWLDPWASKWSGWLPARNVIGHSGWTGTSIWIDLDSGLYSILLSNTCHPSRGHRDNRTLRDRFHTAVAREFYPGRSNVHTGLDRLLYEARQSYAKKQVAVLTNHAALDQTGRHLLDVFKLFPDMRLARIFSPEHGINGQAEAGESVRGQDGPVPVISLFGDRKAPTAEELRGIDTLFIDLQDIGSRYYTYMATMKNVLEVCEKTRTRVEVLDRPNPLGGLTLEGPVATNYGSLVCCAPIPARHGMTMGELALFFKRQYFHQLDLSVRPLDSWRPEILYSGCSLPWTPPSPNIPTPETALVYAGTCLFEGTNLNEGRGTDTPFFLLGAPWLDPDKVIAKLEAAALLGCALTHETYTPRSIPGKASTPRHQDTPCNGIRITLKDPQAFRPFHTTVALLSAIAQVHADTFELTSLFNTLAGTDTLAKAIRNGTPATRIIAGYENELRQFNTKRPRLYAG